jgi:uncharacterized protein YbaR (Trm112 family)
MILMIHIFDFMANITQEQRKIISDELLEILACPKCKGDLLLDEKNSGLICESCKLFYKIEDGIPIMLIDEAIPLDKIKRK